MNNISDTLWVTSGCRFNADRRCRKTEFWLFWILTWISTHMLTLSILLYASKIPSPIVDFVNLFLIILSLALLVIGLIVRSLKLDSKAEKFHISGKEVRKIQQEYDCGPKDKASEQLAVFMYNAHLHQCDVNHEPLDHVIHILNNKSWYNKNDPSKVPGLLGGLIAQIRFYILMPFLGFSTAIVPIVIVLWWVKK